MEVKGVLDRIEDDKYAVILAEEIGEEHVIDKNDIPEEAQLGDWFDLTLKNGELFAFNLNKNQTKNNLKTIDRKMNKLKKQKTKSQYKR